MDPFTLAGYSPITKVRKDSEESEIEKWRTEKQTKEKPVWYVGDFTLGAKLGEGTHSKVYLAKEKESRFVCALKIIKKTTLRGEEKLQRQMRLEIDIQRNLNHPNILQMYAYFHDLDRLYLALEYCPGGQLYDRVKDKLPYPEIISYTKQLVCALVYLHELGIIHRDVKPENLLIDKKGRLRLSDFGWAMHTAKGRRSTICGTLDYMSPEILVETSSYSFPIDAWATGVIVHELLATEPPFAHPSPHQTYLNITTTTYTPPRAFPADAAAFVSRLLTRSEEARLTMREAEKHPFLNPS
eukprot:TRINITY_DN27192_c0_g1_i1.p1 TRINITY_DN27192_c0_g1~~TRINITY_DN27192_c0_g1_i1.p1  ORF type:complete len:324 (+),score=45.44 TRINITY_DN27192_c0_g1_i1:79-972(+)